MWGSFQIRLTKVGWPTLKVDNITLWGGVQDWIRRKKGEIWEAAFLSLTSFSLSVSLLCFSSSSSSFLTTEVMLPATWYFFHDFTTTTDCILKLWTFLLSFGQVLFVINSDHSSYRERSPLYRCLGRWVQYRNAGLTQTIGKVEERSLGEKKLSEFKNINRGSHIPSLIIWKRLPTPCLPNSYP